MALLVGITGSEVRGPQTNVGGYYARGGGLETRGMGKHNIGIGFMILVHKLWPFAKLRVFNSEITLCAPHLRKI